ncbi:MULTISPECIES: lysylphosphatidylglycerol synthase transmembrane domain-containing protein [Niastella]|uniref:Flippase-like domain-containing protein n=1 Tax=Niastella soli TaxID=2821487 RepID=A0ABS3YVF8_9BACT|nr:lysylphosphatidylglycerol synthase transmembrane domain-containing protein [Niastella soli]MBO9201929.1 flippase-like domain-containing protein [Niastella soli]
MKKWLLLLIKCMVAIVAIFLALRHVNSNELKHLRWNVAVIWLLPAILFFNASQFVSAYRLLQYYNKLQEGGLSYRDNLELYYTGMFYNLFLPGGVGGDVYKVIILKNRGIAWAPAAKATLLDRVTGLLVLLSIMVVLLNFVTLALPAGLIGIVSLAIIPGFLLYWFIVKRFFPPFGSVISKAIVLSMAVQCLQLVAFFCLLHFLQPAPIAYKEYAVIFFSGAVVAALPISIGGIGTRELAMTTGALYLHVSATIAVTASLLFYLITAISAVVGWWMQKGQRGKPVV